MLGLSKEQLEQYENDGFLVIPDFWTHEQVAQLKAASDALLKNYEPPSQGGSVFSTDE
jgi:hypothetical protein